jgi:hypothetical protein
MPYSDNVRVAEPVSTAGSSTSPQVSEVYFHHEARLYAPIVSELRDRMLFEPARERCELYVSQLRRRATDCR